MEQVLVSICCLAYNHEKYIRECLDGFLMQKTNFRFEVLIHDDASTDNTAKIIKEYQEKYPDIIKPIYQKENQYSKGILISPRYNFPRVQGKYVAMCEGDDYWTDENKLQKQVDFMEQNLDYSICFHNAIHHSVDKKEPDKIYPAKNLVNQVLDFKSLLKNNFISTNSVLYRWGAVENLIEKIPDDILPGDWYLHLLFAKQGKIKFFQEVMSVYRVHSGGVWYDVRNNPKKFYKEKGAKNFNFYMNVYKNITNSSKGYYPKVLNCFASILSHDFLSGLRLIKNHPRLFIDCLRYKTELFFILHPNFFD